MSSGEGNDGNFDDDDEDDEDVDDDGDDDYGSEYWHMNNFTRHNFKNVIPNLLPEGLHEKGIRQPKLEPL